MKPYSLFILMTFIASCSSNNDESPIDAADTASGGDSTMAINTADNISVVFDIAEGDGITSMDSLFRLRHQSIIFNEYTFLSSSLDPDSSREVKTYECPESGTISIVQYSPINGLVHPLDYPVDIESSNCQEAGETLSGKYKVRNEIGLNEYPDRVITTTEQASMTCADGNYLITVGAGRISIPVGDQIRSNTGGTEISGENITLKENGIQTYNVGLTDIFQFNTSSPQPDGTLGFTTSSTDVTTPAFDLDIISTNSPFQKNGWSDRFTYGSFIGSSNETEFLLIDVDTGDEDTFMAITNGNGSTSSEVYEWADELQFGEISPKIGCYWIR